MEENGKLFGVGVGPGDPEEVAGAFVAGAAIGHALFPRLYRGKRHARSQTGKNSNAACSYGSNPCPPIQQGTNSCCS